MPSFENNTKCRLLYAFSLKISNTYYLFELHTTRSDAQIVIRQTQNWSRLMSNDKLQIATGTTPKVYVSVPT